MPGNEHSSPPGNTGAVNPIERALSDVFSICRELTLRGRVTSEQLTQLAQWVGTHRDINRTWPVGVVTARLTRALTDETLDRDERLDLLAMVEQTFLGPSIAVHPLLSALPPDEPPPALEVAHHAFCFLGRFYLGRRHVCEEAVRHGGGVVHDELQTDTDYLILGLLIGPFEPGTAPAGVVDRALALRRSGKLAIVTEAHCAQRLLA